MERPVGLVVHPDHPMMAATPDGIVTKDLLLEVKCPSSAKDVPLKELAASRSFFLNSNLRLKHSHEYYTQVQVQMACIGAKQCDFFVWTPNETVCDRIAADPAFMNKLDKISEFHPECIVPEIIDPRKARDMGSERGQVTQPEIPPTHEERKASE